MKKQCAHKRGIGMGGLVLAFVLLSCSVASATTIDLVDWAFNVDGDIYIAGDTLPGFFDDSGFDWFTGLGTLSITYNPGVAGAYSFISFFDHEFDQVINGYTNEYGDVSGTPAAGQSWEIDEPGWVFGDIYDNAVFFGSLDNTNAVPSGSEDDVSMAMGWDFSLAAVETAEIQFVIGETLPSASFYLSHMDPDSGGSIYLSSTLNITGSEPDPEPEPGPAAPVPEPGTLLLVGTGLAGMFGLGRKKLNRR